MRFGLQMHSTYALNPGALGLMIESAFAAALCYGCVSDIRSFKIPNAVSLAVIALFFLHHWLLAPQESITPHLIAGGGAFVLTFAVYVLGFMGAGDVKLISALMLWAGDRDGFLFLIVMTLIGGLLAVLLLLIRKSMTLWPSVAGFIKSHRLKTWARLGVFPYGIAICTAGLILMPVLFAHPQ